MPTQEIERLKDCFVAQLAPLKIYLFGSYANGSWHEGSDFDFYIVVDDRSDDLAALTTQAYRAIRHIKQHPVDIVVGTASRFEHRKNIPSVEHDVDREGVLLYGA